MRLSLRRGIVSLFLLCAVSLSAQTPPLNPTVSVLPRAAGPVPLDCADASSTAIAEQEPTAMPEPQPQSPPPAGDLRSQLRAAQAAAAARDRETFQAALAQAKAMLPTASGSERAAAAETIAILDDVARLQEYQFNTPSGSFFDASVQGGSLLKSLQRYPGFEAAMAQQTVTDANGVRYYPTRESVEFLLAAAARGGVPPARVAAQPASPASPVTSADRSPAATRPSAVPSPSTAAPTTSESRTSRPTTAAPATSRPTPSRPTASRPPSTGRSTSSSSTSRQNTASASRPAKRTAERVPARVTSSPEKEAPVTAVPDPLSDEPIVTEGVVSTATAVPPLVTETAPPTATSGSVETMEPASTVTANSRETADVAPAPARRRSIILPLVLILIGIGVLIVLFRASS